MINIDGKQVKLQIWDTVSNFKYSVIDIHHLRQQQNYFHVYLFNVLLFLRTIITNIILNHTLK